MQVVFKHLQITVLNLNTNFLSEEVYVYREPYWHRSAKADTADALCSYIQRCWNFTLSVELLKLLLSALYEWRCRQNGWNDADWGYRFIRIKTCPSVTGVSQVTYRLVWEWIKFSAIRGRRLTAWLTAGSVFFSSLHQDTSYIHWNSCSCPHLVWAKVKIVPL